jgi:C4-dicarboxylate-binding protein DctP
MREATTYEKAIAQRDNDMALDAMKKSGRTQFITLNAQQQEAWKKVLLPVHKQMEGRIGADLVNAIAKETAK